MDQMNYQHSEMADLDLDSLSDELLPQGHKSGFVAVAGRPNVGKSTLMNALLRQKIAIVSPRPQTTRTRQLGIITQPDHQIIFIDTPGIMNPRHKLDEYMVESADEALRDADIILWLVDASHEPGAGDDLIATRLGKLSDSVRFILGMNKADLLSPDTVLDRTKAYRQLLPEADWLLFSALKGDGLTTLMKMIVDALPEGPRYYPIDQTTDLFMRDIAAELIREQVFQKMREELPYGVAVQVDEYKERENGVVYIAATIYVERENHKKIIIGAKGSQLLTINTAARREIEQLVQTKVYLETWVKVEPNWRRDEQALKRLGYSQ